MTEANRRLKTTELKAAREVLLKAQSKRCPLCDGLMGGKNKQPVLDHCHTRGFVRDVLCRNCNGIEGKVFNLARRAKNNLTTIEWLRRMVAYHERHETPRHGAVLHPAHKTEAQKRLAKNKKARAKRAALKEK